MSAIGVRHGEISNIFGPPHSDGIIGEVMSASAMKAQARNARMMRDAPAMLLMLIDLCSDAANH